VTVTAKVHVSMHGLYCRNGHVFCCRVKPATSWLNVSQLMKSNLMVLNENWWVGCCVS